jgi:hypothetical protein
VLALLTAGGANARTHAHQGMKAAAAALLLLDVSSALRLSRADAVRSAVGISSSALTLLPQPAAAAKLMDGGYKDLYKSDRSLLSGGGTLAEDATLPVFDEDGSIIDDSGYSTKVLKTTVRQGAASVQVLKAWEKLPDGGLKDPVTGTTAKSISFVAHQTDFGSIADAGKPENVKLVRTLGLEAELERADLVAAAKRTDSGVLYYEFDLALPAKVCSAELATTCLPSLVVLLAACVRDGQLHVLRIDAMPDQWRRAGSALKALRTTFTVDAAV